MQRPSRTEGRPLRDPPGSRRSGADEPDSSHRSHRTKCCSTPAPVTSVARPARHRTWSFIPASGKLWTIAGMPLTAIWRLGRKEHVAGPLPPIAPQARASRYRFVQDDDRGCTGGHSKDSDALPTGYIPRQGWSQVAQRGRCEPTKCWLPRSQQRSTPVHHELNSECCKQDPE